MFEELFKRADEFKIGDRVCECRAVPVFGDDTLFDARLVGMLIGDGSYGFNETVRYSTEDQELFEYIKSRYQYSVFATHVTKKGNLYREMRISGLCSNLRNIGIYG